jgi:hypothetical protein
MKTPKRPRAGQPRKTPKEKAKKAQFTVAIPMELADKLDRSAEMNNQSRNAEVTERLKVSFIPSETPREDTPAAGPVNDGMALGLLIGQLMRNYEGFNGADTYDHPAINQSMQEAVAVVLGCFGPDGGIPAPRPDETAGEMKGRSFLTQLHGVLKNGMNEDSHPDERLMAIHLAFLSEKALAKLEPKE